MKYGLLVYPETKNLGDDIQSYAALQFLPRVDYFLDREHLNLFHPKNSEPVAAIMNAWYMNNKFNWPPSNDIIPLYISMHFNQEDYFGINTSFLDDLGGDALRVYGSIGCRDTETLRILREKNIPAYFSACLTLTLPRKFKKDVNAPYACLVDVPKEIVAHIKELHRDLDIRVLSQEPHPLSTLSWHQRFQLVEEYLSSYQNANFVITTKLHCALPCLALGTPVLLLKDSSLYDLKRFTGLDAFLYVSDSESFLSGKCSWNPANPPHNPDAYLPYRAKLIQKCTEFINDCEEENVASRCTFSAEERAAWQSSILERAQNTVNQRFSELHLTLSELQVGKDWLEQHSDEQERWIGELQAAKDRAEASIKEKDQWLNELQAGKDWLEQQRLIHLDQIEKLREEKVKLESNCHEQESKLNELKQEMGNVLAENERLRHFGGWIRCQLAKVFCKLPFNHE